MLDDTDYLQVKRHDTMFAGIVTGGVISGIAFLLAVFAAGIILDHGFAWKTALAALGFTYVSYAAQAIEHLGNPKVRLASVIFTSVSVILGLIAGLSLLW